MSESRNPKSVTAMNTGCTSDVQVSAKHNTRIPGPAIYTENPDITPLHRSRPWSKPPTHSPPTPPQSNHRHTSNTPPVPIGLVKPKPNSLIHSPPSPPTPPPAKHIHMSHTPPTPLTTLISSTSPVLDKTPEPRVPLIHALTTTTPPLDPTPALLSHSHSIHTCNTNNSTCITVTATTTLTT